MTSDGMARETMSRDEAARLLGVAPEADATAVRHAYRLWVRVAHPDAGGDPVAFARLTEARRTLLRAQPRPTTSRVSDTPARREPLASVVRRPAHLAWLILGAFAAIAVVGLPRLGVPLPLTAIVAGVAAMGWAAITMRASLRPGADAGHRMTVLTLAWLPLAALQVVASIALGAPLIGVLPLLVVPVVGVVGLLNAGAGLWRPIGTGT